MSIRPVGATFDPAAVGRRFTLRHDPGPTPRGTVILAPPFAEEMNRCRRMISLCARRLAAQGWYVIARDLHGSGDSSGDFGDTAWQDWIDDLASLLDEAKGPTLWLWGVRAGTLLLPALLHRRPDAHLLLWQPVVSGSAALTQFLRLKAAAAALGGHARIDVRSLRATLSAGEPVEVAGYRLAPALAAGLDAAELALPASHRGRVVWLEVAAGGPTALAPAGEALRARWLTQGLRVDALAVGGEQFWQTQEIADCPALLEATERHLSADVEAPDAAAPHPAPSPAGSGSDLPLPAEPGPAARMSRRDSFPDSSGLDPRRRAHSSDHVRERAIWIGCEGEAMLGVLAEPPDGASGDVGVLIVVGGPQYRVGSHRQFALLARRLAGNGIPALRFDYRGMGDSEGEPRPFTHVGQDIAAATRALCEEGRVSRVVGWGLCDAASALLLGPIDRRRFCGLVLVNPWVRSEAGLGAARLKHYYRARLADAAFWTRLVRGRVDWRDAIGSLLGSVRAVLWRPPAADAASVPFQVQMAAGLRGFDGPVLMALSGNDLTAREFSDHAGSDPHWRGLLDRPRVSRVALADADHTFSSAQWREWLERQTLDWLAQLAGKAPATVEHTA